MHVATEESGVIFSARGRRPAHAGCRGCQAAAASRGPLRGDSGLGWGQGELMRWRSSTCSAYRQTRGPLGEPVAGACGLAGSAWLLVRNQLLPSQVLVSVECSESSTQTAPSVSSHTSPLYHPKYASPVLSSSLMVSKNAVKALRPCATSTTAHICRQGCNSNNSLAPRQHAVERVTSLHVGQAEEGLPSTV